MILFDIKRIRKQKNITIYGLSKSTGLSRTYIRNIENNKNTNPTLNSLFLIANALEINIKDLFYTAFDISLLRKKMHSYIDEYGLDSKEVLEVSQLIDLLLNIDMKEK